MNKNRYQWAAPGDINAFFGLMLDNIAGLVLTATMLSGIFGFPVDFIIKYMIPGTAIGVLVGDLLYFGLAFRLAKKENRSNVCAMPLGLDTPSTIGMVLFVLGPAFLAAKGAGLDEHAAAMQTWHIGICALVLTGLIKAVLAFGSNWIRRIFPRAGLLGSLMAIALVLIAFMQLQKLSINPVVGFASLVIVFATLVARGKLPFKLPGAFGAVLLGCLVWYLVIGIDKAFGTDLAHTSEAGSIVWFPTEWLTVFQFEWIQSFELAFGYMPYILPFAVATVIGGIDCAESAASAGDDFNTRNVIGIEAFATFVAGICGGVIQTTPYIGHPAYKAMGGRAAYTLATALFVGGAGLIGYFSLLFQWIPEAAVLPILVFIGIEITAQSFHATPRRHYAALAVACLPALAKLVMIYVGQLVDFANLRPDQETTVLSLKILAGGFIITSLVWASAVAKIIDRRFFSAAIFFAAGGVLILFGVMHSPLDDQMFWPWNLGMIPDPNQDPGEPAKMIRDAKLTRVILELAVAYLVMAVTLVVLGMTMKADPIDSDEEYESLNEH